MKNISKSLAIVFLSIAVLLTGAAYTFPASCAEQENIDSWDQLEEENLSTQDKLVIAQMSDEEQIQQDLADIADGEYDINEKYEVSYIGDFEKVTSGYIVIYPDTLEKSRTKWPVIVWANGTACAPVLYWNALCAMASEGYIVVACSDVMSADGKSQIGEIDYINEQNNNPDSIFYGKVDMDKVGAAGHSQGGRSTVNAAVSDERIKAAVSVAGSSFKKEVKGLKTPAFFMTGTLDTIVLSSVWVKPAYEKAEGPAAYAALKGGVHTTICLNPDETVQYLIKWFDAYLLNDSEARSAFIDGGALFNDGDWKKVSSRNIEPVPSASIFGNGNAMVAILIISVLAIAAAVILIKRRKARAE